VLAAFCTQPRTLELREVSRPEPGAHEVLIKVRRCGICGSDLHFYHGPSAPPRVCLGHEISGEVAAVGDAVRRVACSDRVAVEPLVVCRECAACRRGDYQLCPRLRIAGFNRDGGFAEHLCIGEDSLYRLPADVDFEVGALTEPLAVGVHALRLAALRGGERVLILGAGTIGLLAIAAARAAGAAEIWVAARHAHQEAAARMLGANECFAGGSDEILRRRLPAEPIDLVVETVGGEADTLNEAIRCVRPGGRVAVLGVFGKQPTIDAVALMVKEIRLFGSMTYGRGSEHSDFDVALQLLAAQPERFRNLITHQVALSDIARGFEVAGDKTSGSIKVLIDPT